MFLFYKKKSAKLCKGYAKNCRTFENVLPPSRGSRKISLCHLNCSLRLAGFQPVGVVVSTSQVEKENSKDKGTEAKRCNVHTGSIK